MNEIDDVHQALPLPIVTKVPIYTERTTTQQNIESIQDTIKNIITTTKPEKETFNETTLPTSTTSVLSSSYSSVQLSSSSTMQPSATTSNLLTLYPSNLTSEVGLLLNLKPNFQNNLCTSDGFMGDHENCHRFYRCVGNQKGGFTRYEFSCSESTVWDNDIQACNHAWAVKRSRCGKSSSNIGSTKVVDILTQSTSPKNINFFDHYDKYENQQQTQPNYISNLIQAQSPTTYELGVQNQTKVNYANRIYRLDKKPGNQKKIQINYEPSASQIQSQMINYNGVIQTQLQSDHSNQLSITPTIMSESTTKINSSIFANNIEDKYVTHRNLQNHSECIHSGFVGNSNNCKIFYRCVDNGNGGYTKYEFSCSEGTLWDPNLEACNHAWAVKNCGSKQTLVENDIAIITTTIKPTEVYVTSTSIQTTENYITTLEETDHKDKNIEYNNTDQIFLTTTISNTQVPNNKFKPGDNFHDNTTSLSTNIVSLNSNTFSECKSVGFIGDKNNCKKFYKCVDNGNNTFTRYEFYCGEGTAWDSTVELCNHLWAVDNCNHYTTQEGTIHYDPSKNQNENNSVNTSQNPNYNIITTNEIIHHTSTIKSEVGNKCTESGYMGDNKDCKKFYRCVDNGDGSFRSYEYSCGYGTVWDQKIKGCNHVWAVEKCGERNDFSNNEYLSSSENNTSVNLQDINKKKKNMTQQNSIETTSDPVINLSTSLNKGSQNESSVQNKTDVITTAFTEYNHFTEKNPNPTMPEKPTASDICKSEGFFGDSSNCKKFYRCVDDGKENYNKYEFMCSDGTVWNEEITACDHESSSNKCSTSSTEYPNYTTEHQVILNTSTDAIWQEEHNTQNNNILPNKNQCSTQGFYADSKDCKKFYRCVLNNEGNYIKYDFSCAKGTIWVQDIQSCDHNNGVTNCSLQNDSTLTQPGDSQHSSTLIPITSKTSTLHTMVTTESSTNNTTEELASSHCTSEGYHSDKKDCKKFYRCVDDGNNGLTKYSFTCGEGTAWDEDINGCNHINLVERCQTSSSTLEMITNEVSYTSTIATTIPEDPNITDSNDNSISNCEDDCSKEGYFGNTSDCKKFYRCVDDGKDGFIKYDFTCGDGTIWDQDITACNHPKNVENPSCQLGTDENSSNECTTSTNANTISSATQSSTSATEHGEKLPNTTQGETSKQPVNNNFTCTEAGFFPNDNDCKKFYRCIDWNGDGSSFSIFHFECGEGTIWDPQLETCNYENSVYPPRDCSGTQYQTENSEHGTSTTEATTQVTTTRQTTTPIPQTTIQTTTQHTTTVEDTTTHRTTTKEPISIDKTTQEPTTSTSEQTATSQELTTTTSQTTTKEQTTIIEQTTTQQSITTTTEKESTSKEPTTTTQISYSESTTIENTTTQKSTTEQITQPTTDNQLTTIDQATMTESSTIDGSILTTTQSSSETSTNKGDQETTTEDTVTSMQKCPETDDDQYLFVCPTSFRRHPKYCNLFYQCTEEDNSHDSKIAVFTCPNNTIYDESKVQCVKEDKAEKSCYGEIASRRRVKRLGFPYKEPVSVPYIYLY